MKVSRTDLRKGLKILLNGIPYEILEVEHVKPGKGNAFSRLKKIQNLLNNQVNEITIKDKDGDTELADVTQIDHDYLYAQGDELNFMHPETYEQIVVDRKVIGDAAQWLPENENIRCNLTIWNDKVIQVTLPNFVILEVAETGPGGKNDAVTSSLKAATLSTGAVVKVPPFIETGDLLKIDTRTGQYVERAKK